MTDEEMDQIGYNTLLRVKSGPVWRGRIVVYDDDEGGLCMVFIGLPIDVWYGIPPKHLEVATIEQIRARKAQLRKLLASKKSQNSHDGLEYAMLADGRWTVHGEQKELCDL
jgi:hypothetical protein